MGIKRLGFALACVLAAGTAAACTDDNAANDPNTNGTVDGGAGDGSPGLGDGEDASMEDAGTDAPPTGDGAVDADADADFPTLPGVVTNLVAAAETHVSVKLTWTAPPDETGTGTVTHYEIRYATTPIATEADFLAATAVETPPTPEAPGTSQTATVGKLAIATQYYMALRAQYADESYGPLSNIATVTTKTRATFLISEIAPVNTTELGGDFIELVATSAGSAADLQVCDGSTFYFATPGPCHEIHKFGPLDVSVGDRVVVHVRGLPGPTGFVQEDATKSKTSSTEPFASANAYDVYANQTELYGIGSIGLLDGVVYQDGVTYSDRNSAEQGDASYHALWGFMHLDELGAWSFSPTGLEEWVPIVETSMCPILLETVNASGSVAGDCGGPAAGLAAGSSLQRNGTVDTNMPADFTIAPQTRGAPN